MVNNFKPNLKIYLTLNIKTMFLIIYMFKTYYIKIKKHNKKIYI